MEKSTRGTFDRELAVLDTDVGRAAFHVGRSLTAVAEALTTGESDGARRVVASQPLTDASIRWCEARAFALLARHSPAAGDLRFLVTVGRITHELERSSKLTSHLAAFAATPHPALPHPLTSLVGRMAEEAHQLFQGAVDAYVRRDEASGEALDVWDDRLDALHRRFLRQLFDEPPDLATTLEVVLVGRYLERVADHAVTIGRWVRYLVTGGL